VKQSLDHQLKRLASKHAEKGGRSIVEEYLKLYEDELFTHVMPFWMKHSLDRDFGGYFTCLETDGQCYDPRKYLWMQGRQIWMLSRLYNDHERRPEWLEAAELGVRFIRRWGRAADGRVHFALTREGRPAGKMQRKIFSECFYAMGLAEYCKASGDASAGEEALEVFAFIERLIDCPEALGIRVLSGNPVASSLAVPMIMLGMLEIFSGLMEPETLAAKSHAYAEKLQRHYVPEFKVFRENVALSGSFAGWPEERLLCPGHSIEAAWFLMHYARTFSRPEALKLALEVIEGSMEVGWDREYGGLYYFVDSEAKPLTMLEWSMKLWWPHTEALYALVAAWCETGQERFRKWHRRVHDYSFQTFADHAHGEWFGYCDRRGKLTHQAKGNLYKGCFHVPRALFLSLQTLKGRYDSMQAASEDRLKEITPIGSAQQGTE